ncbi:hypothetical protein FACS1894140_5730 [Spirochaetia bacterium]|nr:hypothetical protein FACS1894140_5730 [Spirochaetia bacterium]
MEWRNSDSINYFPNSNLQIYNTLLLCCVSTNGERKSFKIEESRLVDKIFNNQKPHCFDGQQY